MALKLLLHPLKSDKRPFSLVNPHIQKRYIKAGAQHTKLIVVPDMAHKHPDAAYLTEALQFLLGQELTSNHDDR